jgi:hypothetical protein
MKIFVTLTLAILTIFATVDCRSQDFERFRDTARKSVMEMQPGSKLLLKDERKNESVYSWTSPRGTTSLLIFYGESTDDAVRRMDYTSKSLSLGPGKPRTDIGDEAYWSDGGRGRLWRIRFRKAAVYVEIGAPSLSLAMRIARDLEKKIMKDLI